MGFLDILINPDGSIAWVTLIVIAVAFVAGWVLQSMMVKKKDERTHKKELLEAEARYRKLEGDYKNYKANLAGNEKHKEKALQEMTTRVKALEGDIRALAEERNKLSKKAKEEDDEVHRLLRQISEKEDTISTLKEKHAELENDWVARLRESQQALGRAQGWEEKAKHVETEVSKARAETARAKEAMAVLERQKLEAELRLKAVTDFAARVGTLEKALAEKDRLLAELQQGTKPAVQEAS